MDKSPHDCPVVHEKMVKSNGEALLVNGPRFIGRFESVAPFSGGVPLNHPRSEHTRPFPLVASPLGMSFSSVSLAVQGLASTPVTAEMLVVFALILLALVLFATEWFPIDVTAILIMVLLMVLEPWTQISPRFRDSPIPPRSRSWRCLS